MSEWVKLEDRGDKKLKSTDSSPSARPYREEEAM